MILILNIKIIKIKMTKDKLPKIMINYNIIINIYKNLGLTS